MLGIPAIEVDGMDLMAVRRAMQEACRIIREERGPVFIEAQCYRFLHQSGPRPGSEFGYRSREEEAEWKARDPFVTLPARLERMGVIDQAQISALDAKVRAILDNAVKSLTETIPGSNQLRVPSRLWPDPATIDDGIRGDLSEFDGTRCRELDDYSQDALRSTKFIAAASDVIANAMERDSRIVILGEDVHRLRGGVSGATKGALERWPERVLAMPIAENGFVGVALGAALAGLRPIVEIMFGDFCLVAADQLFNQTAKIRHMFGGDFKVPVVLRVRVSPHTGYGSQHSGDPTGFFAQFPGWRIVAPTTPFDYIGLMNSALRCDDPVLVVEHVELFQKDGPVPLDDLDFCIPFGKARIVRSGSACTVLAWASMVGKACEAALDRHVDAEIIDLRTLDPTGLDWETVEASIRRTNRVLIAEQGARGTAMGAKLVQEIQARVFDYLDHEIVHVTGSWAAPVVSAPLNGAALAGAPEIGEGLSRLVAGA
jgi:2-oxoisovalerate dehydrogenase E1 component